nr:hypothetical protein Datr000114 [Darna trima granulovirus]
MSSSVAIASSNTSIYKPTVVDCYTSNKTNARLIFIDAVIFVFVVILFFFLGYIYYVTNIQF